jgi:hypothetical protein
MSTVAVSWCRCGPYADVLTQLRSDALPRSIEWIGHRRWIAPRTPIRHGATVELCSADLCHEPGELVPLAAGHIQSVAQDVDEMVRLLITVDKRVEGRHRRRTAVVGKLVSS